MSEKPKVVYAKITGFIGFNGRSIELIAGQEWSVTDPVVQTFKSQFFTGEKPKDASNG